MCIIYLWPFFHLCWRTLHQCLPRAQRTLMVLLPLIERVDRQTFLSRSDLARISCTWYHQPVPWSKMSFHSPVARKAGTPYGTVFLEWRNTIIFPTIYFLSFQFCFIKLLQCFSYVTVFLIMCISDITFLGLKFQYYLLSIDKYSSLYVPLPLYHVWLLLQ